MEEERRSSSMTYQTVGVVPYDWEIGVVGFAKWQEDMALALNQVPASAFKAVLASAFHRKEEYHVKMKSLEDYKDDESLSRLSDAQIEQIVLEDIKRQSKEASLVSDARRAATMAIHDTMGKLAKQKLLEDEVYHSNLISGDPKPSVAIRAIERVIVTQRSGDHPASIQEEHNKIKRAILSPQQRRNESEWDYFQREERLVAMAEKMGINVIPDLYKDEQARALAFTFGLDSIRFKAWHIEIKNRVSEAPQTRKAVLQAARERSDKGDWTPETKKPEMTFVAAAENNETFPHRYKFLKREDWDKLTPEERTRRKAYNSALLKEAGKLQEEMAKKKESYRGKQGKKEAAMVTTSQEEQEFVLLVAEGDGIRYKIQRDESEEEAKKRKRDFTPPRKKAVTRLDKELVGDLKPTHGNVNHHLRQIHKMYPEEFKKEREKLINKLLDGLELGVKNAPDPWLEKREIRNNQLNNNNLYLFELLYRELYRIKGGVERETKGINADHLIERDERGLKKREEIHDTHPDETGRKKEDIRNYHHSNRNDDDSIKTDATDVLVLDLDSTEEGLGSVMTANDPSTRRIEEYYDDITFDD